MSGGLADLEIEKQSHRELLKEGEIYMIGHRTFFDADERVGSWGACQGIVVEASHIGNALKFHAALAEHVVEDLSP